MKRFIDENRLMDRAAPELRNPGSVNKLRAWLRRQPRAPRLVSRSEAATMLGTTSPYISRLHDQGRMPEPLEVEGSAPVYIYDEVAELAKQFNSEREERRRKRLAREKI